MATLRFAENARQDLLDIRAYIARDKPQIAEQWVDKLEQKCTLLAQAPEIGEKCPRFGTDIRFSLLGRYIIYYRAFSDGVEIIRVVTGDRKFDSL